MTAWLTPASKPNLLCKKAMFMDVLGISPQTLFPVITLVIGAALKAVFDSLTDRRTTQREREARREQRLDAIRSRRVEFQRATLLELQEAISQLMRYTGRSNYEDVVAYRTTRKWKKQYLTDEVDEGIRSSQVNLGRLRVRVRDEKIRQLSESFSDVCANIMLADTELTAEKELLRMASIVAEVHERIGLILRSLDDEDEVVD